VARIDPADGLSLDLGDRKVPVTVRRSALARRTSLRIDAIRGVVLVLPLKASLAEATRFVNAHRVWVAERLARLPVARPLEDGAVIPILGIDHTIRHCPQARRGVWIEEGFLNVSGLPDQVGRRVQAFLKQHARLLIGKRVAALSATFDRKPGRITVRDTRSRWGSCSARGDLSFSWRLVMAPDWVLSYVVAHELAHLVEMNHSPDFWSVVAGLCPDAARARMWLKRHGAGLHRFGECATD
jgi:predicted metal-dependent hydrolase